jgi:hypothetical protein
MQHLRWEIFEGVQTADGKVRAFKGIPYHV